MARVEALLEKHIQSKKPASVKKNGVCYLIAIMLFC